MDSKLFFPQNKSDPSEIYQPMVPRTKNLLDRGIDPKPILMELCEPMCVFWKEKLKRCEKKLEKIIKINPTKSCLYPMRDYVTCVEACVRNNNILFSYDDRSNQKYLKILKESKEMKEYLTKKNMNILNIFNLIDNLLKWLHT